MSTKLRVYEVARDLGMDNKALVALLQSVGVSEARNHMSAVPPEAIERVKRHLEKQKVQGPVVEERIRPTVVKRRAVGRPGEPSAPVHSRPTPPSDVHDEPQSAVAAASAPISAPAPVSDYRSSPAAAPAPAPAPTPPPPPHVEEAPVVAAAPPAPAPVAAQPAPAPVPASAPAPAPAAAPAAASAPSPAVEAQVPPPAPIEAPRPIVPEVPPPPLATPAAAPAPAPVQARKPAPVEVSAPPRVETPPPVAAAPAPAPVAPTPVPVRPATPTAPAARPSTTPKTGIDVWEGRPGVPMPQVQRGAGTPRRVQYDPKAGAGVRRPGPGGMQGGPGARGPGGRPGFRGRPGQNFGGARMKGAPVHVATQERGAHKKIVRIEETISLQALAGRMGIKATEMLMKLMRLGMTGVNINSTLDADTAKIVANEFGWEVEDVAVSEADQIVAAQGEVETSSEAQPRPAVVTVMGHVDHGKTSLLDRIRKANVAQGEAGGITQHIGAYSVETAHGRITFLDTPGHEAFTAMRARGARTTDLVVLVVAADDGVMPQTKEAIAHAKAAKVPIVVAVNKSDKPEANHDRVKRQLSEAGLVAEDWGGDTLFCPVSALTGAGVDHLLEQVALQAEMLELRAAPNRPAVGVVIEAQLDRGRGPVATVLITDGTLNAGDVVLAGGAAGKVRAMQDSYGRQVKEAGPSMPVEVIGLSDVPSAGDAVHVIKDMKKALEIAESRKVKERKSLAPSTGARAMSLEELHAALRENEQLELKLIIKADVQGSVEAVSDALTRLTTDKVRVNVVHEAAGAITEGDVNLALAAGAIIIGFNVRPAGKAAALAQKDGVQIRHYNIIYNVVDEVKAAMEGLLAPAEVEKVIGKAEIRQVFRTSKSGNIAGCMVTDGAIRRSAGVRLMREGALIWTGKLSGLKRFKDDAREVKEGFDCGMSFEGFQDFNVGDVIEAFEIEKVKQTL